MTAREIKKEVGLKDEISLDTVKRTLRKKNYLGRISALKSALTKKQRLKRKKWCNIRKSSSIFQWSKIIFTDECPIYVIPKHCSYVRHSVGQRLLQKYVQQTQKHSLSIIVWQTIRFDGHRVLIRCIGNVDSTEYQRILSQAKECIYSTRY